MACVCVCVCMCRALCVCLCVDGSLIKQGLGALSVYRRLYSVINTDWNREIIAPNKRGNVSLSLSPSLSYARKHTHMHIRTPYLLYDILSSASLRLSYTSAALLSSSHPPNLKGMTNTCHDLSKRHLHFLVSVPYMITCDKYTQLIESCIR